MGVQFDHDGAYLHGFRDQATRLDADPTVRDLAALYAFWGKCTIAYNKPFTRGEDLARKFPEWAPSIRYALARAHGARLSFSYALGPEELPDIFPVIALSKADADRERAAAIRDFLTFISERPADPEAVFAWQEVWRLRAGLKPSRVPFGCSGE